MVWPYIRYLRCARNAHSLHSPFLFDLYTRTIRADAPLATFADIEALRAELSRSNQQINITDFGAGSKVNPSRQRTIGDIARHSQKPPRFGRLLYRLAQRFQAKTVFDIGTSLGLTTAYLARGVMPVGGQVVSFEGCPQTAAVARQNLAQLGCSNVGLVIGNLDETLTDQVAQAGSIDLIFFDANHRFEPTVRYFNTCLSAIHNNSVFIFDDIHWSAEMEAAWEAIKVHPAVTISIDLFHIGIVFFRKEQPKQHFVLRF